MVSETVGCRRIQLKKLTEDLKNHLRNHRKQESSLGIIGLGLGFVDHGSGVRVRALDL